MTDAQILADLQAVLARALEVARAAPPQTADRKAHQDFVTDVDRAVDTFLEQELASVMPGMAVLSEERAVGIEGPLERYWIVDPIDGTLNLMSGLPPSAIACALVDAQGPRIGAVVNIQSGSTYTAIRGAGAWRDGRAIRASARPPAGLIILSSGLMDRLVAANPDAYRALREIGKLRNLGSQALHLCHVASGAVAGVASVEARVWDEAAAGLILREAGGIWTAATDRLDWTDPREIMEHGAQKSIAAHAAAFEAMQTALAPVFES
ncbi:inositol monophosphatase family protein [Alterinioella nitratireducens]|uniref:inositol monophosphatase family protein n=1 Tax=Alterinioella nitratireducens TaxID=2735915 RepID=UPI001551E9FE|nr:inositol monophosphatase [Alterinioella nitratireducens]NPD21281.1 inositol monophosphatase [Alterinioella nitratireducens]